MRALPLDLFAQPALTESWQPENISIGHAFVKSTREDLMDGRTLSSRLNSSAPFGEHLGNTIHWRGCAWDITDQVERRRRTTDTSEP
jgi:hypothetical protein